VLTVPACRFSGAPHPTAATESVWQRIHLAALGLVAVAVAFVMAPAAYHRQAEQHTVSNHFIALGTLIFFALWFVLPRVGVHRRRR